MRPCNSIRWHIIVIELAIGTSGVQTLQLFCIHNCLKTDLEAKCECMYPQWITIQKNPKKHSPHANQHLINYKYDAFALFEHQRS